MFAYTQCTPSVKWEPTPTPRNRSLLQLVRQEAGTRHDRNAPNCKMCERRNVHRKFHMNKFETEYVQCESVIDGVSAIHIAPTPGHDRDVSMSLLSVPYDCCPVVPKELARPKYTYIYPPPTFRSILEIIIVGEPRYKIDPYPPTFDAALTSA